MKYVRLYDPLFDESFQCEISDETFAKMPPEKQTGASNTPFPDVPIKSRFRSERHPEWNEE